MIRMTTDQLGGTTYTFANLDAFLANTPTHDPVPRRPERAEPVQQRRDRAEAHRAGVLRRLRAGRVARDAELHAELRPPLRLLHAADGSRQPDRQVQHRHRRARSRHDAALSVEEEQLPAARRRRPTALDEQDRAPRRVRHLRRPGPDRGSDSADRGRAHQHDADERRAARVPGRPGGDPRQLHQQPEQPLVSAARLRERLHASGAGLPVHRVGAAGARRRAWPRRPPTSAARDATCSCAASPTRSSACSRTARPPATQIREFDIVTYATPTARIATIQQPVRRNRLQDQRRPRQLQRAAAVADPPRRPTAWR